MMKKILLVALMSTGYIATYSQVGDLQKQCVSRLLVCMHAERGGPRYPELMNCISPMYLQENHIDRETHKVNNYTIWGFVIDNYTEADSIVTARIYGEKKSWMYNITFKVTMENNRPYIWPSSFDSEWIHPWWTVEEGHDRH